MKSEEWVKAELKRMCEHHKKLCLLMPEKGSMYDSAEYITLGRISALEEILED